MTDQVSRAAQTTPAGTVGFFPGGLESSNGTSPCTLSGTGGSARWSATFTPSGPEAGGNTQILVSYNGDWTHLGSTETTTVKINPMSKAACAGEVARIVGSTREDRLAGTDRGDVILGGLGSDLILAGGGDDRVRRRNAPAERSP